eukprot:1659819-Amphidinium_carterae.2
MRVQSRWQLHSCYLESLVASGQGGTFCNLFCLSAELRGCVLLSLVERVAVWRVDVRNLWLWPR